MSDPIPVQPFGKSAGYGNEIAVQTDINSLLRFFATKAMRASLTSPPLAKDVGELEVVVDKSALRIYTKIDGTLRYWGLT